MGQVLEDVRVEVEGSGAVGLAVICRALTEPRELPLRYNLCSLWHVSVTSSCVAVLARSVTAPSSNMNCTTVVVGKSGLHLDYLISINAG